MAAFARRYQLGGLLLITVLAGCRGRASCLVKDCLKEGDTVYIQEAGSQQQVVMRPDVVTNDDDELKKEISAIKNRLDLNESMTRLLRETVAIHEQRIAALESKSSELEAAVKSISDRVNQTQASLTDINARISASQQQLLSTSLTRNERRALQDQIKALETQQLAMKAQLEQLAARTLALENFKAEQQIWNSQFTENLAVLSKSINMLDERVAYAEFNIQLIEEAVDGLTRSLLAVKDKMARLEAEQVRIVNHMATVQDLYEVKMEILTTLRGEIAAMNETMSGSIEALNELIATKELCTAGEKYIQAGLSFVDLSCGPKIVKVLTVP